MEQELNITSQARLWLELLLKSWVSKELTLVFTGNMFCVKRANSRNVICFDVLQRQFWNCSCADFKVYHVDTNEFGLSFNHLDKLPMPSFLEKPDVILRESSTEIVISFDVFGLAYWNLNRLEEFQRNDLDEHLRFPDLKSQNVKNRIHNVPTVDYWFEVVRHFSKKLWPDIELVDKAPQVSISHDVDRPLLFAYTPRSVALKFILKNYAWGDLTRYIIGFLISLISGDKLLKYDPLNTFKWLMETSDKYGHKSTFYFLAGGSNPDYDANYSIKDQKIKNLLISILQKRHEVGLHPSYDCFSVQELQAELSNLSNSLQEIGYTQTVFNSRNHYLRWKHPNTLLNLSKSGLSSDNTLGYSKHAGFRCGTCKEYVAFDHISKEILPIIIRPLIFMECSKLTTKNLTKEDEKKLMIELSLLNGRVKEVGGTFSMLWHNSFFPSNQYKKLYQNIISMISER